MPARSHGDINMADAEDLIARAIAKLAALEAEFEDADFTRRQRRQ